MEINALKKSGESILFSNVIAFIFDLRSISDWDIKSLSVIPSNAFGVFVTVRRSPPFVTENNFDNVHVCIGYWNDQGMSKEELLKMVKRVGKSAMFEDERRNYFPFIYLDPDADIEISWMIIPKIPLINGKTQQGINFDNNVMGLIAQYPEGDRATYLPHVFPNEKWENIKNSLIRKASSTSKKEPLFFAYNTIEYSQPMIRSFSFLPFCSPLNNFMLKYGQDQVPYSVSKDGNVYYDPKEWVRNLSVINSFVRLDCITKTKKMEDNWKAMVNTAYDEYQKKPIEMRQAMASVLLFWNFLGIEDSKQKKLCNDLYSSRHEAEPEFEKPQIVIALATVCPIESLLIDEWYEMFNTKETKSIFQVNWEIQYGNVLVSLYSDKDFSFGVESLANDWIKNVETFNVNTETNYFAVAWESLAFLEKTLLFFQDYNSPLLQELRLFEFVIVLNLWSRLNPPTGLYAFISDGSKRLDITNHIISGQTKKFEME